MYLIILPTMAGGVSNFLCHLGGGLFRQTSACLYDLLQKVDMCKRGSSISGWRKSFWFCVRGLLRTKAHGEETVWKVRQNGVSLYSQCHRFLISRFWCMKQFLLGNSQYKDHHWDILYSGFFSYLYIFWRFIYGKLYVFKSLES